MQGIYTVYRNHEEAGKATVERKGLYYTVCAMCKFPERPHRLFAIWQDKTMDLGIFVPENAGFYLKKTFKCQLEGKGVPRFEAMDCENKNAPAGITVELNSPFPYLTGLDKMHLAEDFMLQIDG